MDFRLLGANPKKLKDIMEEEEQLKSSIKLGSDKGSLAIIKALEDMKAQFDIFMLPPENKNGSFNSVSDCLATSSVVAKKTYESAGYKWLQRPTIFWNPGFVAKIYCRVTGVENFEEPVGFRRVTDVKNLRAGQTTLILRSSRAGAPPPAKKINPAFAAMQAKIAASSGAQVGIKADLGLSDTVVITAREIDLPPWVVLMHELGHAKQYFELAERMNLPAHHDNLETAWGAMAFSPGRSAEPDNIGRHEAPISDFLFGGHRERYYHDAFHFGKATGYDGWRGGDLNYSLDLTKTYDNFIFKNGASEDQFDNMIRGLPVYEVGKDMAPGYYRYAA